LEDLANKITESAYVRERFKNEERVKIQIGVGILIENITKAIIIILLSILLKTFKETVIIISTYAVFRYFTFGIHSLKSINCTMISVCMDVIIPILFRYVSIKWHIEIVVLILCCILIKKYSPADTENHPLYNPKLRRELNIKATILSCLVLLIAICYTNYAIIKWIMLSEIYVVVGILPITYKLLKRRYNNYEKNNHKNI
jgi:accessory gene regulator B